MFEGCAARFHPACILREDELGQLLDTLVRRVTPEPALPAFRASVSPVGHFGVGSSGTSNSNYRISRYEGTFCVFVLCRCSCDDACLGVFRGRRDEGPQSRPIRSRSAGRGRRGDCARSRARSPADTSVNPAPTNHDSSQRVHLAPEATGEKPKTTRGGDRRCN